IHSPDGVIQQVNASVSALLGLPRSAVVGRSIGDFLPPTYKRYFERYLQEARASSSAEEMAGRFPVIVASGLGDIASKHLTLLEYRSRVIRDSKGCVEYFWGIARDQTLRVRQEKSLGRSAREIQRLFEASEDMRRELADLSRKMMRLQEEDRL